LIIQNKVGRRIGFKREAGQIVEIASFVTVPKKVLLTFFSNVDSPFASGQASRVE
jgi:hypothetical protein